MNRRSFMTALAGLPIVGWGAGVLPKVKSEITVHGPEWLVVRRRDVHEKHTPTLRLWFDNVPSRDDRELNSRLKHLCGVINRSEWHGEAGAWMLVGWGVASRKNGLRSVICYFTPASNWRPWGRSHRPVDFEMEILKALTA